MKLVLRTEVPDETREAIAWELDLEGIGDQLGHDETTGQAWRKPWRKRKAKREEVATYALDYGAVGMEAVLSDYEGWRNHPTEAELRRPAKRASARKPGPQRGDPSGVRLSFTTTRRFGTIHAPVLTSPNARWVTADDGDGPRYIGMVEKADQQMGIPAKMWEQIQQKPWTAIVAPGFGTLQGHTSNHKTRDEAAHALALLAGVIK